MKQTTKQTKQQRVELKKCPQNLKFISPKQVHQMEVVNQGLQETSTDVQSWGHLSKELDLAKRPHKKRRSTQNMTSKTGWHSVSFPLLGQ